MRKLDLKKYTVSVRDAKGVTRLLPYDFKETLIQLLFHPSLRLTGKALLETNKIAEKIEKADKEVLLEEEEYRRIKNAVDTFQGFSKNEVKLVQRIYDCPVVEVEVKKERK